MFSQFSASGMTDASSPSTPSKSLQGMLSNDKDPADQVTEKDPKSSGIHLTLFLSNSVVQVVDLLRTVFHGWRMALVTYFFPPYLILN